MNCLPLKGKKLNKTMYLRLLFIFIVCFSLASCIDDSKKLPHIEKLEDGRYVVVGAKRNGKMTATLNSGFYEIKKDSAFTNLTQNIDSVGTTFIYRNNEITHKDPQVLNFIVSKMTSDSLELNTELKGFEFELYLVKESKLENQE